MAAEFRHPAPIRRFTAHPVQAQEQLLSRLLRRAADTEWGRRYGFRELADAPNPIEAYRTRVPLQTYDNFRSDVRRARRGERDIFWPGAFRHFAVSSGTVSEGKLIPLSEEMLRLDRNFALLSARNYLANGGEKSVLFGRLLTVPGRIEEDVDRAGVWAGEVSGLLALFSPGPIRSWYEAVPLEVLFRPNWDAKLDAIADLTLTQDIRAIAMVPSWAVVLFRKLIERFNARYGRRVRSVRDIWPNLSVFFSGGVALSSYRALLERQIGVQGFHFVETYGASEGFLAFQDRLGARDMLLHLDNGVFLEFVHRDDTSDSPVRYSIAEVEEGVPYQVFVSTCSGLWAYGVGDVVRFTSTAPHRIVVAGRTDEVLDLYGEAVYGEEARAAIDRACRATGASVRDYHVAPIGLSDTRMPGHQWLVEFEVPPVETDAFAAEIDRYLQTVNRHYVIRREAEAFTAPQVVELGRGTFYTWLERNRQMVSAQSKVPRMSEGRRIADEVLSISGNNT